MLADPDFRTPGSVDLLLGAGVFIQTVLNGWQAGPLGSPWAIDTCFEWVVGGATDSKPKSNEDICYLLWFTLENRHDHGSLQTGIGQP